MTYPITKAERLRRLATKARRNGVDKRLAALVIRGDGELIAAKGLDHIDHLVTRLEWQARGHDHNAVVLERQADALDETAVAA